jgi:protein SCO1/2
VWDDSVKEFAHPTGIVVVTPDGRIARYLFGVEYAPKDLRLSLVEASQGKLGNVVDQLLLLCFHYDPKVGKYGPLAIGAMRTAGAFTLLGLGAIVTVMVRRERKSRASERASAKREGSGT